jgi:hypothetical protein
MLTAIKLYDQARSLNPDYWVAFNNIINANNALGREEAALRVCEQLEKRRHRGDLDGRPWAHSKTVTRQSGT